MLSEQKDTDVFGYPLDGHMQTELAGLTAAHGWFACYKYKPEEKDGWFFDAIPQFMTVRRTDTRNGSQAFCIFGVQEFLGQLERMDVGKQFMGYAHATEFVVPGETLKESGLVRLEAGETMCGEPSRFLNERGHIESTKT